jgi:ferredoxin-NADP reductase
VEGTAVLGRLNWRAAKVVELTPETSQTKTITFDVPGWPGHRAGQHVDVRLTADDGYQAERSYSIASAADGPRIDLTVERLDDGEVSPYLTDELRTGDVIELRGPVGGYFVWNPHAEGTVFLVAGGSGIVPLMAMAALAGQVLAHEGHEHKVMEKVLTIDEKTITVEDLAGKKVTRRAGHIDQVHARQGGRDPHRRQGR